jgi:hypothetical protein
LPKLRIRLVGNLVERLSQPTAKSKDGEAYIQELLRENWAFRDFSRS